MTPRAHVVGWGKCVPPRVLTNDDLTQMVDTSDEWIRSRTGIAERHVAVDGETTSSMALHAAWQALAVAGLRPTQLDLIIVATVTPDYAFPATACLVQDGLGATHAAAFDLSAGCTGFVYGLSVAADLISSGAYQNALVIGAETLSRIIDWARYSFPARRAASPVHRSSGPRMAKFTPALSNTRAKALEIFFPRSSKAPAQPTKKSTSASGRSHISATSMPRHQSARDASGKPHGLDWFSMLLKVSTISAGKLASISTR